MACTCAVGWPFRHGVRRETGQRPSGLMDGASRRPAGRTLQQPSPWDCISIRVKTLRVIARGPSAFSTNSLRVRRYCRASKFRHPVVALQPPVPASRNSIGRGASFGPRAVGSSVHADQIAAPVSATNAMRKGHPSALLPSSFRSPSVAYGALPLVALNRYTLSFQSGKRRGNEREYICGQPHEVRHDWYLCR